MGDSHDSRYAADWSFHGDGPNPVPLDRVDISGFLGRYVHQNLDSLLFARESALFDDFKAKATGYQPEANTMRLAADSDVYKWLEGACYVLARTGDSRLREAIDSIASLILSSQSDDGYINTQVPPKKRFDPKVNHDLYIAGHFFEAAVAHVRATGRRDLLEAASRWADYLIEEYKKGNPYFGTVGSSEHSEYELGLLRLYRETRKKEYLDFAIALAKMSTVGPKVADIHAGAGALHAVRVGYLLSGLTDLYMETGDKELYRYLPDLWRELVETRSYATGAIGSHGEMISTEPWDLPHTQDNPDRTMGETCSSIAMVFFSWRMFSAAGKSECYDVIERIFYNHILGALVLNGMGTFYYNPMEMVGDLTGRTDHWHTPVNTRGMLPEINKTFCCMPNCWRLLGALPEYIFSRSDAGLYINLYTDSSVRHVSREGNPIKIAVETSYPHSGKIAVRCTEGGGNLSIYIRIPAWCEGAVLELPDGGRAVPEQGSYYRIDREWHGGDTVTLDLPMPIRIIQPDPRVAADTGRIVFARGPLVYCLESDDIGMPVEYALVCGDLGAVLEKSVAEWRNDLFGGVHTIRVPGDGVDLTLIPWYCRANRGVQSRWVIYLPVDSGIVT